MSTISDFFAVTTATTHSLATPTPRPTHGTTCQMYTFGCCACCCIHIPTASSTSQTWTYEMWGQGGGGASGCCCYYSPYGGDGGEYGAARQRRSTGTALGIGFCACSCWCCYYNGMNGHPGQFSRLCEHVYHGWTMSSSGGRAGWTCCHYVWHYPCDCNMEYAILGTPAMISSTGGIACRMSGLAISTNGNACGNMVNPLVCLPIVASQAPPPPPAAGAQAQPGSYNNVNCYFVCDSVKCCQCGTHTNTVWVCCLSERFSRGGSCGYAKGSLGSAGIQSNNYLGIGVGGGSYAGGNAQLHHSCTQTWTWHGCMGQVPGGGGSSGGGCQGDCCFGSVGGAGLVIVSYDN